MKKPVPQLSNQWTAIPNLRARFTKISLYIGCITLTTPMMVQAAETATEPAVAAVKTNLHSFNIGKQPLYSALNTLAEQGGVQFVYTDEMVKGLTSPGVIGQHSTVDALNKVLAGSGLGFRFSSGNTVTLEHNAAPAPAQLNQADPKVLPVVKVTANAGYDPDWVKDPYNTDYVLPNATAGTKTDTPIMETPLNVQVISKQVLKDQQVIRLDQALKNVSGVTSYINQGSPSDTSQNISLRGFSTTALFRNGFRMDGNGFANFGNGQQFANVESLEVLKGPAAILYGRVEPGGMINMVTKQPRATPYYSLNQQFGSYDLYRTSIDATGPLTKDDTLLYRVNASFQSNNSFRDLVQGENVFFAPILKW